MSKSSMSSFLDRQTSATMESFDKTTRVCADHPIGLAVAVNLLLK